MRGSASFVLPPSRRPTVTAMNIVQMPPGIPVATVAIGGARNAGVLATQIIALSDVALASRLREQCVSMAEAVAAKSKKVEKSTR